MENIDEKLDKLISILSDPGTSTVELVSLAEDHDLRSEYGCECELCFAFREFGEFETIQSPHLSCSYISMAILSHPACDEDLTNEIRNWVSRSSDGEWKLEFDLAYLANARRTSSELLAFASDSRAAVIHLLKNHPNLTPDLANQILDSHGWSNWPSEEYFWEYDGFWIEDDADDLSDIQKNN